MILDARAIALQGVGFGALGVALQGFANVTPPEKFMGGRGSSGVSLSVDRGSTVFNSRPASASGIRVSSIQNRRRTASTNRQRQ